MKNTSRRELLPSMPLTSGRRRIKRQETDHHPADQDLILFQELHKREKERNIVTLLQPVSEEFEPNGNHQLYRIASAKKGSGFESLAENEKNDYDWLKTPPATPLFPSLEMDANGPEFIIQREIPILQPRSRFAVVTSCKLEAADKKSSGRPKSRNPISKVPLRSVTPSTQRRSTAVSDSTNQINITKAAVITRTDVPILNQQKASKSVVDHNDMIIRRKTKPTTTCRSAVESPFPLVRSTNTILPCFSNEKPPNLRIEQRSLSATRDRSVQAKSATTHVSTHLQRSTCTADPRRPQSCSSIASISRDRKVVGSSVEGNMQLDIKKCIVNEGDMINTSSPKEKRSNQTRNERQVLGSRMVQRVMSARSKATTLEEKNKIPNSRFPLHETSGFGRMILKSSMDTTLKHLVPVAPKLKRDGV
ncbi:PREDICTED: uncharacterized protein LOC101311986 isoform X2 [Fragaria vesca subsp. vesca]|uniref:uncharacterized protein LOC101311986 isoform X2 n=1 Tax=Fragaria vesca subsp. vesca TaxID=101020 RepID=UPI0002C2FE80|nr:PREDICTED: uncharacterized protein LOC101311986 isoform X2 [Fragaria vesca subsp. vesca]